MSEESQHVDLKSEAVLTGSAVEEEKSNKLSKESSEMEAENRDELELKEASVEEGKEEKTEDLSLKEGVEGEETDLKLSRDFVNEVPILTVEGKSVMGSVEGLGLAVDEKGKKASLEIEKENEEIAKVESFEVLSTVSKVSEPKSVEVSESVRVSANVEDKMDIDFGESLNRGDPKVSMDSETTPVIEDEMKVDFDESLNEKDSKVNIDSETTPVIEDGMKVDFDESLTKKDSKVNSDAETATFDELESGKSNTETEAEPKKSVRESDAIDIVIDLTPKKGTSKQVKKKSTASNPAFKIGDLIWGKVRSHPWWPGQICDPKTASKKAKKYFKRDSFLIAYYGDNTFAWNESSLMKPFLENFPQMEKQSNTEDFHFAVDCALEEISRRVEFSLICPCVSEEISEQVKSEIIVNTGIQEEFSKRQGGDRSLSVSSFEPAKLVKYIIELAQNPRDGADDRLEFSVSQSQLSAFSYWKGYSQLPEFEILGMILENDADVEPSNENKQSGHSKDNDLASEKETSKPTSRKRKLESKISDLVVEKKPKTLVKGNGSGKKHNAKDYVSNILSPEPKKSLVKGEGHKNVQNVKSSFRVGESIRRVASQLNGSSPILKNGNHEPKSKDEKTKTPEEPESEAEAEKEPEPNPNNTSEDNSGSEDDDEQSLENIFGGKKSTVKRQKSTKLGELPHQLGPKDDSYWSDRIGRTRSVPEKEEEDEKPDFPLEKEKDETAPEEDPSPTALILNFSDSNSVPSETNLNKIFGHYGSLSESETEIFKKSNRAKVIFKKRSDAETAFSSAGKYSTFGPALVSYRLKYLSSSSPVKTPSKQKRSDADEKAC